MTESRKPLSVKIDQGQPQGFLNKPQDKSMYKQKESKFSSHTTFLRLALRQPKLFNRSMIQEEYIIIGPNPVLVIST